MKILGIYTGERGTKREKRTMIKTHNEHLNIRIKSNNTRKRKSSYFSCGGPDVQIRPENPESLSQFCDKRKRRQKEPLHKK